MRLSLLAFAFLLLPHSAFAQRDAKIPDPDPELERKTFVLPEGFEVNLYASDPMLAKPTQMNFDSKGRLWVAASEVYPQIKPGQKANDKILILEDTTGKGVADKTTVFADGLLIPTAVEPDQFGGAYVADSTDLVHFSEPDKAGKATKKKIVLSGFGTEDTHHILHTFRTGPDGMLYMSQSVYIHSHIETPHGVRRLNAGGIWQFNPKTEKLEVFARGWWNSWGTAWDKYGATFATDGAGGQGINYVVPGAYYDAARDAPRMLPGLNPGSPKYCGLEILSGRHLPDDWEGNLITNDFRGHRVCRFIVKEDGAGFVSKEQKELIKSTHPAFRPIDVKMGPDGAIYIADWYNPIIQHGEVDFRDERRDHTHGRIWRITVKDRKLVEKPKISGAKVLDLLELLKSPEQWTRSHARREIASRQDERSRIDLLFWCSQNEEHESLFETSWVLQQSDNVNQDWLLFATHSKKHEIRAAACRIWGDCWQQKKTRAASEIIKVLQTAANDDHPRIRLEAVRALAKIPGTASAIASALDKPTDRWLDYAIFLSLRETKDQWLPKVKDGSFNFGGDPKKLAFALQAAGENDISSPLVAMLNSGKTTPEEIENILLTMAKTGGAKEIGIVLEKCDSAARRAKLLPVIEESVRARKIGVPPGYKDNSFNFARAIYEETGPARQSAMRLAGFWKLEAAGDAMTLLAGGEMLTAPTSADDRAAAFEGLVLLGGKKTLDFLTLEANNAKGGERRPLALIALVQLDAAAAAGAVAKFLPDRTDTAGVEQVVAAFVNRKGGTALLIKALADKKLNPDVAKVGIRAARATAQPDAKLIEVLTKAGGLTEPKRTLTPAELDAFLKDVKETGDPVRGEAIYRRAELNCLKCHGIAGAGGQVGPDMTSIGASAQPDYLLESLLNPNAKIKEGFNSFIVTTFDDRIYTGIKVRETPQELVIRDAEDKEITISKADKPEIKPGRSLMPDGATDNLTRAELVDLVRFLSELGKGKYLAQPGKVIRRWQAVTPTKEFYTVISRDRLAAIATNPDLQWTSVYSTVFGDLPISELPTFKMGREGKPQTAVRFQFEATTAGKASLRIADVTGLQLWLDGVPIEPAINLVLDVRTGLHTLTAVVETEARKVPLRAELEEAPDSPVRLRILGGK
jgi:putative heme-binding domain-containing protein